MIFPKAMSEIELIVPAGDLLQVAKILAGKGLFHQVEAGAAAGNRSQQREGNWVESAAAYAGLDRRVQMLLRNLAIEESVPQPGESLELLNQDQAETLLDAIEEEVQGETSRLADATKSLETLRSHRQQLTAVADIDLDIKTIQGSRFLLSQLGTIPAANVTRLQSSLARVPHMFLTMIEDSHRPVVWVGATTSNRDVFERATRSAYFEPLQLPSGYEGSPRQVIQWLDEEIRKLENTCETQRAALSTLAKKHAESLSKLAWKIRASRSLAEAILKFGRLRHTYIIVGWVPSDSLDALLSAIRKVSKEAIVETTHAGRAGDRRNVPVALGSSRLLQPFQMLVTTYARPKYGEVDPTWLIALTFPLLFGAMFGDVGHGVLLAAFGLLLTSRKVERLRGLAGLGGLLTVCGLVAAAFGFLYGSIFGFEHVLHAAWLQPSEDPLSILAVAIGAGVVLLSIGFLVGMFNSMVSRDWAHLLFGHGGIAAALLYWSLLGLAGSSFGIIHLPQQIFVVIAAVTGLMMMFSGVLIRLVERERPLVEGGVGTYAIQAPIELLVTFLDLASNSLSYVRVGAFAIAHVVLSSVVFLMAGLVSPSHGAGYWIIVVLGNIGIVLYEGLIVGIQTLRLSYYEFFSKFFAGGGITFEPLSLLRQQDA